VLGLAGTALTFGMWWTYFVVPSGAILAARRERRFSWAYGHIPLFAAVVAVGAGLHAAAYYVEHHTMLGTTATVLTVVVPLAVYIGDLYLVYSILTRSFDPFHMILLAGSVVLLILPVVLAATGTSLVWCLTLLALVPWVTVAGYETVGHRHNAEVLAGLER
jgi:low temperature requirement protein LtrA